MVSSSPVPWYNVPAREFPVHIWLRQRYGFRLPRLAFARVVAHSASDEVAPRPFPAQVWWQQRRAAPPFASEARTWRLRRQAALRLPQPRRAQPSRVLLSSVRAQR